MQATIQIRHLPPRRPRRSRLRRLLVFGAILFIFLYFTKFWSLIFSPWHSSGKKEDAKTRLEPKVAFATLLSANRNADSKEDVYYLSARMLNYQLRHSKKTRSRKDIPFLILVTEDVPSWKRELLANEGATIIPIQKLSADWIKPLTDRWADLMAKLRLWELVEYDCILFLDADTYLLKPMDGIFHDPAAEIQWTHHGASIEIDEAPLPQTYVFASHAEVLHTNHPYPPLPWPRFNAGFFLLSPSTEMFQYYLSLLSLPDKFDSTYVEQSLLNYAHREHGNMPWVALSPEWNINLPNTNDVREGVRSIHAKLWTAGNELQPIDKKLRYRWERTKLEMEKHFRITGHKGRLQKE